MVKIDHDVPLPPTRAMYRHFPFEQMQPGDSFYVADLDGRTVHRLQVQLSAQHAKADRRYTSRRDDAGIRIWRVE